MVTLGNSGSSTRHCRGCIPVTAGGSDGSRLSRERRGSSPFDGGEETCSSHSFVVPGWSDNPGHNTCPPGYRTWDFADPPGPTNGTFPCPHPGLKGSDGGRGLPTSPSGLVFGNVFSPAPFVRGCDSVLTSGDRGSGGNRRRSPCQTVFPPSDEWRDPTGPEQNP